jgi:transposase-like protein
MANAFIFLASQSGPPIAINYHAPSQFPDQQNKALTVRLHPMTTQAHDEVVRHICVELTATETVFPGTDLHLIYEISGSS